VLLAVLVHAEVRAIPDAGVRSFWRYTAASCGRCVGLRIAVVLMWTVVGLAWCVLPLSPTGDVLGISHVCGLACALPL
jgi:hypothetical protein